MALSDWRFLGLRNQQNTNRGVSRTAHVIQYYAFGGGAGTDPQGGQGAVGEPKARASYSNPLDASIAGDYARIMPFSSSHVNGLANFEGAGSGIYGFTGVAHYSSSTNPSGYPVTDTPSNGTLMAQSVRAFVRLDQEHTGTQAGSSVGLIVKGERDSGTAQYKGYNFGFASNSDSSNSGNRIDSWWGQAAGYNVELSTYRDKSSTADPPGHGGAPRLVFTAPEKGDLDDTNTSNYIQLSSSNSFSFNTWYHIRMDVVPAVGSDTVTVYTAPTSGAGSAAVAGLGSETWTQQIQTTIASTHAAYVPWDDSDQQWAGFRFSGRNIVDNDEPPCDVSLDVFQFLHKDVS